MLQELEAPVHPKQKKKVVEAIRTLGFKVVPADVAAASDLPVLTTTRELNAIAAETGAHLLVSDTGQVTYAFDPRFEQAYALNGTRHIFRRAGRVVSNAFLLLARLFFLVSFFVLRVSFGILLVASVIVLIVVAIVAVLRLFGGSDSGGGGDVAGGGDVDLSGLFDVSSAYDSRPFWLYWTFDWLWDWIYFGEYLWWRRPYRSTLAYGCGYSSLPSYYDDFHYSGPPPTQFGEPAKQKKKSKFLDQCFILLFGPEDANADIEEKSWREIARVIRWHQGIVVFEQLAPYLPRPGKTLKDMDGEDAMLPVLLRFNGIPDVSDSGNIIYTFPAFQQHVSADGPENAQPALTESKNKPADNGQKSAHADELRALYSGHLKRQKVLTQVALGQQTSEPYLKEEPLSLGNVGGESFVPVFAFAGFAVVGSVALLSSAAAMPFLLLLSPLLLAILAYGSLFFIVPAIRFGINLRLNKESAARNEMRLEYAAKLA